MMNRGLLTPAYGFQYVGMGKELYDQFRIVQEYFEEASDCININFVKLAFASSDFEIHSHEQGPLLFFLIQAASIGLLQSYQIPFSTAGGMDMLSWYSALHATKSLTLPDGLYLIKKWIEFTTKSAQENIFVTLLLDTATIENIAIATSLCEQSTAQGHSVRIVSITPTDIRITGVLEGIAYFEKQLQHRVSSHRVETALLNDIVLLGDATETFMQYFEKIDIKTPSFPVIDLLKEGYATTSEELKTCSQGLLTKPLRTDLIIDTLTQWREGIMVLPSLHYKEKLITELSSVKWYTMETLTEFHQLIKATISEHYLSEKKPTTEE